MIYWATLWYKKFSTTQRSIDMEYVVTGCFVKRPTESQMSLAERNNGWQKVDFHNTDTDEYVKTALWNSCVSPIFPTTRHDLKKLYPKFKHELKKL